MLNSKTIHWGLAGCGDIARKRVVSAIQSARDSELLACIRKDARWLKEFQTEYRIPKGYSDLAEFLADPEIDAVYLATPVALHCPQTIQAAERGKHVLCEKPMAMDPAECRKMIEACSRNGVKLAVAYYRRFYPIVLKIQELLRAGALGEPILVRTTLVEHTQLGLDAPALWRFVPAEGGGGLLMDMASHRLDVLAMLFGLPSSVAAFADTRVLNIAVEDTGSIIMRFPGGAHAVAFASHCIRVPRDDFEIFGTKGHLRVGPLNGSELEVSMDVTEVFHLPKAANVHLPLVEDFNQAIRDNREPRVSGQEGMKASLILDAAYRSARQRAVINCE